MRPGAEPAPGPAHHAYIDVARGLAVLGVVLIHAMIASGQTGIWHDMGFFGQRGVQLFYVVSAYTLVASLDARRAYEAAPLRNFWLRRLFRIAPMFWLAIVANLAVHGLAPREGAPDGLGPLELAAGFLFLHGLLPWAINGVVIGGWSIAVEAGFYLLLPWIWARTRTIASALWMLLAALTTMPVLAVVGDELTAGRWSAYFAFFWLPIQLPVFLMGIFAYRLGERLRARLAEPGAPTPAAAARALMAGAAAIVALNFPTHDGNMLACSLAFVPLLLALSLLRWDGLAGRVLGFFGRISYSLYLLHFFLALGLRPLLVRLEVMSGVQLIDHPLGLAVSLALLAAGSAPLAWLTWRLVELPGIDLGRRLIRRLEAPATAERQQAA